MADNTSFRLECCDFDLSMKLAFSSHKTAVGYYSDKDEFVLFWTEGDRVTKFPVPLNADEVGPMVKRWLAEVAEYPQEPDIDGHCSRSWLFETDSWGKAKDFGWQSFVKITPDWAMHGK